ncbi:hypothetical protein BN2476_270012 [Paraburkholderia piptadeniae]|uniref:Uncharacterized protein n=1 Tax=Paraburkholderia piptadeniae TaxID=1701573 RepID=A0A1N7S1A7_9BURK|nr:hypothetical protein BN2476_270012 [Paraburkholderia piptadeniae]
MCQCGGLAGKGDHRMAYRSVFGRLSIDSLRLYQSGVPGAGADPSVRWPCLRELTSPELCRVDVVWSDRPRTGLGFTHFVSVARLFVLPKDPLATVHIPCRNVVAGGIHVHRSATAALEAGRITGSSRGHPSEP